jgi:RNA polymerase primary sigma factor
MDPVADYLAVTCALPPPTAEEERELFLAGARDELVMRNTRLVVSIAKKYQGLGLPFRDLMQEGVLGLLKAVDRFEVDRGFRFSSYATHYIRRSIVNAVKEERVIRIPRNSVDDLARASEARQRLTQELNQAPTMDELAKEVDMDKGYIRRLETADSVASIDEKPEGGDPYLELFGDDGVEGRVIASTVADELRNLDERTEDIIRRRWLLGQSYREIAEGYDVTRERVRQIAVEGLAELRGLLGVEA